jgi:hypothetical protein
VALRHLAPLREGYPRCRTTAQRTSRSTPRAARAVALRHLAPLRGGYPHRRGVRQGHLHLHLRVLLPLLLQQLRGPLDVRRSISPARLGGTLT